ncbi:Chordin-like protein 2 [Myotis brandtii]|uniref:Chordin-like protein 2 n=1 Tax=Myotis brandtii TaxID=109478 RepID=S7MUU0_MYOBR|nr:Chordin-like protein 2 [Myotis brandtii]
MRKEEAQSLRPHQHHLSFTFLISSDIYTDQNEELASDESTVMESEEQVENAHVNCYRLHCPPVHCPQPVTEPQQCCPRCVEPHTPSGLRAPPKSCQHNGTMYQHGEMFSAHELFPSRLPNQCVLCSCTEGQIYCGLMTCPEPGCPAPLPLPSSCCQACKNGSSEKSAEEDTVQSHRGADGRQDCQRVTCPAEYPCHHPEKVAGKCCKICPEDKAEPGHREISATRCPKAPGRVLVHTSVSPSPDNLRRFALEREASEQVDIYLWKLVKGHWNVFLAQTPELKVMASLDKGTKTL